MPQDVQRPISVHIPPKDIRDVLDKLNDTYNMSISPPQISSAIGGAATERDEAGPTTTNRPTLLVGNSTHFGIADAVSRLTGSVLLLTYNERSVYCSGTFGQAALDALIAEDLDAEMLSGPLMAAADYRLVEEALCATQTAIASEAAALARVIGAGGFHLLEALQGSRGTSWSWEVYGPNLMHLDDETPGDPTFKHSKTALGDVVVVAERQGVYSPLTAMALQAFQQAALMVDVEGSAIQVSKSYTTRFLDYYQGGWEDIRGIEPVVPESVAVVGLGAMGASMADHLSERFEVIVYDPSDAAVVEFASLASQRKGLDRFSAVPSAAMAASMTTVLLLVIEDSDEEAAKRVLLEASGGLEPDDIVILCTSAAQVSAADLEMALTARKHGVHLIDASVWAQGAKRRIICSGLDMAGPQAPAALAMLEVLCKVDGRLSLVPGGVGQASAIRMIDLFLANANLWAGTEALVLAEKLGLPMVPTRHLLSRGRASSSMMRNAGLLINAPGRGTVDGVVAVLSVVMREARRHELSLPLTTMAHQQSILAKARGWGKEDESSIIKLWQTTDADDSGAGGDDYEMSETTADRDEVEMDEEEEEGWTELDGED